MTWVEQYRPSSLDDIIGNKKQIKKLREWAEGWTTKDGALILYGPSGVGKTSASHALAREMDWETMEMNASDNRTGSDVRGIGLNAAKNGNLSSKNDKRTLVIIDEADNLSGTSDRGGKKAMTELVKDAKQPVILIANEFYDMSRSLRNSCENIEFGYVDKNKVAHKLRSICEEENIDYTVEVLKKIADLSDGDIRSAINDLEAAASGDDSIQIDDITTGKRDRGEDIFPYLDSLFKDGNPRKIREMSRGLDESPEDLIRWIEENLTKVYRNEEVAKSYKNLSLADRWLGRVRASQNYKYWRNASDRMTVGVATSKKRNRSGWTRYGPPRYNSTGKVKKQVANKIADEESLSVLTVLNEILPYLSKITRLCKNREATVLMTAKYDFNEKEVSEVTGSGESTNKVQGIVEEAQERMRNEGIEEMSEPISMFQESSNTDSKNPEPRKDEETKDSTQSGETKKIDDYF